ncbi:alpha/beta fold hydrolase [Sphingomonas radiodurans]|uniref:alpha/beta fold hydrolase n=1 Tax=Sphingomonas radiodurans TaxID=2890321 RepID=UPI001E5B4C30|nr:alpha/beta hydrolase [Sphingomonas radiodurans]WBH17522.1 alpha/beta hydrolase [Sphingomonas radiodurans]
MRIFAAVLALLATPVAAQTPVGPNSRTEAVKIIAGLREIVSPDGLQASETIPIGGIKQVVSIRSQDLRNPVLIYFHGGPGFVETPLDWWWGRGWDEYFTVVHWDQRNAGKTFTASGANDPALLTAERYQRDAEEVVQWALKRFGKRKLFVLGHSWGSMLGLKLAAAHPEWLHAYIGMGQLTDGLEGERRGWAWTMARARAAGNAEAVRELESIAPYAAKAPVPVEAILIQRKWLTIFGGAAWRRPTGAAFELAAIKLSPEYSDDDVRNAFKGQPPVTKALLPEILSADLAAIRTLKTPLLLLLGRHDITVSSEVAAEWFARVKAPSKQLVWFERSGHHATSEEPGKLLMTLVTQARPIAAKAGDVAP